MKITDFQKRKHEKKKISMVTCYDYTSARIVSRSAIDAVLVGDSVAMMMYGASQTVAATTEMMTYHTRAVVNGLTGAGQFIVADMPFPTVRLGEIEALKTVDALVKAGAHAVKAEGVSGHENAIGAIVGSGVPVMGHLGLTPQSVLAFGGYRVQGRDERAQNRIIEHAVRLEDLGCFALVLECIPAPLAQRITARLQIPTIGIGAGVGCDGQILVWQDLLGLQSDLRPRFVRRYLEAESLIQSALDAYDRDVKEEAFPNEKESYP
jgi:3-methyl-2-oxobutanoate hydroxymethyltransferase